MTESPSLGRVRAVLFDMDGLLIDSERIYTDVVNEILRPHGKEQTWEVKSQLMGKPERDATLTLFRALWPPRPGNAEDEARGFSDECPFTIDSFLKERNARLLPAFESVPAMPGAERLVAHLEKNKIPICVATGSKRFNYQIKSGANPTLFRHFGDRAICGDDKAVVGRGKPTPDIFLVAAHHGLGLQHSEEGQQFLDRVRLPGEEHDGTLRGAEHEILVFEDALPGVQAGLAAGMRVVWVPDPNLRKVTEHGPDVGAHQQIDSLEAFQPELWGLPPFDA
ncbi:pseudouridine 5'-phosphatase [Malassezia furfur]|uniref:Pseudouridine 5'-phosphatase n=1 Tax=Malassezia furfur TaxID=55194 RepID=A0ABY8EUN6_MALFU|nr:pseudouridine 5'-phosphatase [Malassezia furfur]